MNKAIKIHKKFFCCNAWIYITHTDSTYVECDINILLVVQFYFKQRFVYFNDENS